VEPIAPSSTAFDDSAGCQIVRRAFGCTFNDVVMAVCSGALRGYRSADCLPKESLIAIVPVSVRSSDEADT
jgi:hypothetical protein